MILSQHESFRNALLSCFSLHSSRSFGIAATFRVILRCSTHPQSPNVIVSLCLLSLHSSCSLGLHVLLHVPLVRVILCCSFNISKCDRVSAPLACSPSVLYRVLRPYPRLLFRDSLGNLPVRVKR
jgi:hypothetical protein